MRALMIAIATLVTTNAVAQTPLPSFCERLAPQIGLKPKSSASGNQVTSWEVNTLGGLKTALLGGSTLVSFGVTPVGEATNADYQRLQKVCAQTGKELSCRVTEPLHLSVNTKNGNGEVEAKPGEVATVALRGTRITCRNS